jgi:D-beta-D-heptose 7-phosphate kinase/D-beta-D-heptose 1-phosphate adenosyltransferase
MPKVLVTGGFDPFHIGHLDLFLDAACHGDLYIGLNSDEWLIRKKGYVFMPWAERAVLLVNYDFVQEVFSFDDGDDTAIEAIYNLKPDYFANGGDRSADNVPEVEICNKLGVKMLWGVGGNEKRQSSGDLVAKAWGDK